MLHKGTEEAGGETDGDGAAEADARDGGVEGFCVWVGDSASRMMVLWHVFFGMCWRCVVRD